MAESDKKDGGFLSKVGRIARKLNEFNDMTPEEQKQRAQEIAAEQKNRGTLWKQVKGGLENHFKKMDDLTPGIYEPPPPPPPSPSPKADDQKSDAEESTHKAENEWYYASEGEKHGPIAPEKLTGLLASGVIGRDTIVWRHGMSDWMPLDQTELWASVPEAESPPPLPPASVSDKKEEDDDEAPPLHEGIVDKIKQFGYKRLDNFIDNTNALSKLETPPPPPPPPPPKTDDQTSERGEQMFSLVRNYLLALILILGIMFLIKKFPDLMDSSVYVTAPFEVSINRTEGMGKGMVPIEIQSATNNLEITHIEINKGRCEFSDSKDLPVKLNYGESYRFVIIPYFTCIGHRLTDITIGTKTQNWNFEYK